MLHQPAAVFQPVPSTDDVPPVLHPDEALLDLGGRWTLLVSNWEQRIHWTKLTNKQADDRVDDFVRSETALIEAIAKLPAQTAAGLAVKARLLARSVSQDAGRGAEVAIGDVGFHAMAVDLMSDGNDIQQTVGFLVADLLRLAQVPSDVATAA